MIHNSTFIQRILKDEDIEGFIASGAPLDEYDSEALFIENRLVDMDDSTLQSEQLVSMIA